MGKKREERRNKAKSSASFTKFLKIREKAFNQLKQDHAKTPQANVQQTLSLDNLNNITSVVDGKDMAQVDCEAYFNNNIIYFMNDDYRKNLLGVANKPALSDGLKAIVADEDVQNWYKDLSVPWIALGLNGVSDFNVNGPILQSDMTVEFQKTYYLDQSNLLYHYAYADRVQAIIPYIEDGGEKWADDYKTYILDSVLSTWMTTVSILPTDIVNLMIKQWTSKLDLLDPTGDSSRELNQKLSQAIMTDQIFKNMSVVSQQKIFRSVLLKALNDAKDSSENQEIINNMKALMNQAGGASFVAGELASAYSRVQYAQIVSAASVEAVGELVLEAGVTTWTDKFKNALSAMGTSIKNNLLGTIFMTVSSLAFVMGVANWNVSDNVTRAKTVLSAVGTLIGFSTTTFGKGLYAIVAKYGNKFFTAFMDFTSESILASPLKYISSVVSSLFGGIVSNFINKIAVPVFMVASVGFLIYDMVQDARSDSWGAFSMDTIAAICTIGYMVLSTLVSTSWSGPLSIVFAIVAGLATLAKIFLFKPKTPLQQFKDDLPTRYKNTSLKIYTLPSDISNLAYLKFGDKYCVPDKDHGSNRLGKDGDKNYKDPFQVMKIQESGMVTMLMPFNSYGDVPTSFLSCRSDNLTLYGFDKGPAVNTESWLLIDAGDQKGFYLYGWDSKYISVDNDGKFSLSKDTKTEFTFTSEVDWFDLNTQTSSLLYGDSLKMNGYIANSKYGLALVNTGAYIINMPDDVNNFNVAQYIKEKSGAIFHHLVQPPNNTQLGDDAFLALNDDDFLPTIYDGDKTYKAGMDKTSKDGQTYSSGKALAWPNASSYDYKSKIVDEQYRILYHVN
ncbi:hypothetical protein DLAC_10237 [Tieghemostelium lacteum]|uniref:Uncharacterized protein n=1 Tax=Tieghemostelium lacteum TaxID=361077 RepID=A0A151Z4Y0_TIELA|nr:hypothetical protein DLAC_10237 [Tieghemostelium lacteum]|eukprot:KYQ89016.1 hypothetical protein DLAC_10237 [Tieghemostelium lacteum]